MDKKIILTLILSSVMMISLGCQSKPVEPSETTVVDIVDEVKTSRAVMEEFESVKSESAFEMLEFIDKNIGYTDVVDADELITTYISKSNEEIDNSNDYLYGDGSAEITDTINKTLVFNGNYSIFADKKNELIDNLNDKDMKSNLSEIFKKGHGLISTEGSYYAVVDYLDIYNKYANMVSSSLSDYLEIISIETTDPSTVEEYLAISIDELKVRMIRYEKFLIENGNELYSEEVKSLYMFSIWKIVNPSIYDGQLNNDYTVNEEMMNFYNETKDLAEFQVLQNAVKGTLEFINSRDGGVVGSLTDDEDIRSNANMLYENAENQIDKLYINK